MMDSIWSVQVDLLIEPLSSDNVNANGSVGRRNPVLGSTIEGAPPQSPKHLALLGG